MTSTTSSAQPLTAPPPSFINLNHVVPREPDINWTQLSKPVETTAHKVCRRLGISLLPVAFLAGVGRYLAAERMTASPDMIINTCFALRVVTIVSAVSGAALWFFNRLDVDPSRLRDERSTLGKQIGTGCLADLCENRSPFVISNKELNQWIRYLVQKDLFDKFLENQSNRIFDLPLEDETKQVLKDRYLAYVQDPNTQISLTKLKEERAFKFLPLSNEDREGLQRLVANRQAGRLEVVDAAAYAKFIQEQGIEAIPLLGGMPLERLAPGFTADAYDSKVGIRQLKKERKIELDAFGEKITTPLYQDIANREGLLPYLSFRERNDLEVIDLITKPSVKQYLLVSFSAHVVSQGLGLVRTNDDFDQGIKKFGEAAAQSIYSQVLNNEMSSLEKGFLTYTQFRVRNGIDTIEFNSYGNFDMIHFFREHFLRLPYADLVNPHHKRDRDVLGVTNADIKKTLRARWTKMSLKDVLTTDGKGFIASLNDHVFKPRAWTEKAVQETQTAPIKDVIATYGTLFSAGVLLAADGNFINRLAQEIVSIADWKTFIDAYGSFVFEHGLLKSTQVQHLVLSFVDTYAASYLNETYDKAILPYVAVINTYCLTDTLAKKIKDSIAAKVSLEKKHKEWLTTHEATYARIFKERTDAASLEIISQELIYNVPLKLQEKNTADEHWRATKTSYETLAAGIRACEEGIRRTTLSIDQKDSELRGLQQRKQELERMNVHWYCPAQEVQALRTKDELKSAERDVQNQSVLIQTQIAGLKQEETELAEKIQKIEQLQQERDKIKKEIDNPKFSKKELQEKIDNPNKPVTGRAAAEKAKKELKEAPVLLAAMEKNEKRFAEVKALLDLEDYKVEPLKNRLADIKSQIEKKQAIANEARLVAAAQNRLSELRTMANQTSQAAEEWRKLSQELQALSQKIACVEGEIKRLNSSYDQTIGALREKRLQLRSSRQQLENAISSKEAAALAHDTASLGLAQYTAQVRQACTKDLESRRSEKAERLKTAEAAKALSLQQVVNSFRQKIYEVDLV